MQFIAFLFRFQYFVWFPTATSRGVEKLVKLPFFTAVSLWCKPEGKSGGKQKGSGKGTNWDVEDLYCFNICDLKKKKKLPSVHLP